MTQEMFSKPVVSGGCLVEGTKIKLSSGIDINIEEVEVGMKVATLSGEKVVTHKWNPETLAEGEPECYRVTFEDGHSIICSETHEFLIGGNWVEAKDLKIMDMCTLI
jgi:intein/homing endonuclease